MSKLRIPESVQKAHPDDLAATIVAFANTVRQLSWVWLTVTLPEGIRLANRSLCHHNVELDVWKADAEGQTLAQTLQPPSKPSDAPPPWPSCP